ncbi:MAG: hypothetical protein EYC70_16505 [Planctomycetota bacterium]|nr:MAG: hypothetical protein EYC70_16505 [Planctomycetota bacterium]
MRNTHHSLSWPAAAALLVFPALARAQGRAGDYNGDGHDDLAVAAPYESAGSVFATGAVHVFYGGSGAGLSASGDQVWTQNSAGVVDSAENSDQFGRALTHGDFDGDGYDDLAIGVPFEDIGSTYDCGAVHVLYGSASGLQANRASDFFHQDSLGVPGTNGSADNFAAALCTGDFNGDGYDDLAIGVPYEDLSLLGLPISNAGSVTVLLGSAGGLTTAGAQVWNRLLFPVGPSAASGDNFGAALASGDFDHQGHDDLAIGAPFSDVGGFSDAGSINVLYSGSGGLSATSMDYWDQDVSGVPGSAGNGDRFGYSLAAGDFRGNGTYALAIGVPFDNVQGSGGEGSVNVLYGSNVIGLGASGAQLWYQDYSTVAGSGASYDWFGQSLAVGDFDQNGAEDLAIGAISDDDSGVADAGAVNVLYGKTYLGSLTAGLFVERNQQWHQNSAGVLDLAEGGSGVNAGDSFGRGLLAGDFDGDGAADLAVGANGEDIGTLEDAGCVNVLYGASGTGITATGDQLWTQDSAGVLDAAEANDYFGYTLG